MRFRTFPFPFSPWEVFPFPSALQGPIQLQLALSVRFCIFFGGPTTLYQIEKGFKSSGNNIVIRFYDELYQPNAIDKDGVPQQKCDESWSMDNLRVRVIKYQ